MPSPPHPRYDLQVRATIVTSEEKDEIPVAVDLEFSDADNCSVPPAAVKDNPAYQQLHVRAKLGDVEAIRAEIMRDAKGLMLTLPREFSDDAAKSVIPLHLEIYGVRLTLDCGSMFGAAHVWQQTHERWAT